MWSGNYLKHFYFSEENISSGKAQNSRIFWSVVPHVQSALFPENPESLCRHTQAGLYLDTHFLLAGSFYCCVMSDSLPPINLVSKHFQPGRCSWRSWWVCRSVGWGHWARGEAWGERGRERGLKVKARLVGISSVTVTLHVYWFTLLLLLECKSREVIYCPNHKLTS